MITDIPGLCKLYILQIDKSSINMLTAFEHCIELINDNCGFTVVGWYNRGFLDDKSLIASQKIHNYNGRNAAAKYNANEQDIQVDSGEISYHIVSINPKYHEFMDPTSQLGRYL